MATPFDLRWLLPPGTEGSVFTMPTTGPQTFSTPVQPDGASQQQPPPAEPPPPLPGTSKTPEVKLAPPTVPDERTVPIPPASSKVPEVLTKTPGTPDERLTPTAASTAPTAATAGNIWDRYMALMKDPKAGPAIAALAKGFGAGNKGPAPPPAFHVQIGQTNPGFNQPNAGSAQQMLQQLMQPKNALGRKRKERQDDPMQFEQDMYDFRRLRGRG
jgi:hypothetical protein